MPTGYTAPIHEAVKAGEEFPFPEFVRRCARAMGALIMQRDDPLTSALPDDQEVADHYVRRVAEAETKAAELLALDFDGRLAYGQRVVEENLALYEKSFEEKVALRAAFDATREKVKAWEPPTPEHEGLKAFMLQQIDLDRDSEDPSYYGDRIIEWRKKDPKDVFEDAAKAAHKAVGFAHQSLAEERYRVASRNAWVRALKDALPE